MITASWAGNNSTATADELGCNPKTARVRLHRSNVEGLDGLGDQPSPGRPPRLSKADRSRLIALVKQPPPEARPHEAGQLRAGEAVTVDSNLIKAPVTSRFRLSVVATLLSWHPHRRRGSHKS